MPKVSDEYRAARRDEIALAAIRVLERKGVRDTSIADIVKESGLSTGAIYSHFSNKAELARYIVSQFLLPRAEQLSDAGRHGDLVAPADILRAILAAFASTGISPALVLQFWGEAMVDAELHDELLRTIARLRGALESALLPWARGRTDSDEAASALATTRGRTLAALAQGYISNTAVFGTMDAEEYLAGVAELLGP